MMAYEATASQQGNLWHYSEEVSGITVRGLLALLRGDCWHCCELGKCSITPTAPALIDSLILSSPLQHLHCLPPFVLLSLQSLHFLFSRLRYSWLLRAIMEVPSSLWEHWYALSSNCALARCMIILRLIWRKDMRCWTDGILGLWHWHVL